MCSSINIHGMNTQHYFLSKENTCKHVVSPWYTIPHAQTRVCGESWIWEEDLSARVIYKLYVCGDASSKNSLKLKITVNLEMHIRTHSKTHTEMHLRIKFWQNERHSLIYVYFIGTRYVWRCIFEKLIIFLTFRQGLKKICRIGKEIS